MANYGYPGETLTDSGPRFFASEGERRKKGVSRFEAYLAERGLGMSCAALTIPGRTGSWGASTASTTRRGTGSKA